MHKYLKSIIDAEQERGETCMTRLFKSDDDIVRKRKEAGSTYSLIIADLVHKGLLYESLERGAGDPVLRNLLKTIDGMISHRINEAALPLRHAIDQTQLFTAALFVTLKAGLTLPLQNANKEQLGELQEACTEYANQMLDLLMTSPVGTEDDDPQPQSPDSPSSGTKVV